MNEWPLPNYCCCSGGAGVVVYVHMVGGGEEGEGEWAGVPRGSS